MSFYSDIIESNTFTGGTYHGDGHHLIGMVTGVTYNTGTSVLTVQRYGVNNIAQVLTTTSGNAVTMPTWWTYTANTDFVLLTGGSITNDVSLTATSRTLRGELVAVTDDVAKWGYDTLVPRVSVDNKGRITNVEHQRIEPHPVPDLFGIYRDGAYVQLPRANRSAGIAGNIGRSGTVCMPFHLGRPYWLVEMGWTYTTSSPTHFVKFAVYTNVDMRPRKLVADFGTIIWNGVAVSQTRSLLGTVPLSGGTYFACINANGTMSSFSVNPNGAMMQFIPFASSPATATVGTAASVVQVNNVTFASSASTWPDMFETNTFVGGGGSSNVWPIAIRLSGLT